MIRSMRRPLTVVLPLCVAALCGCRERLAETPRLEQARKIQSGSTGEGALRASAPPEEISRHLTGGRLLYSDDFEREALGSSWSAETENWKLAAGEVTNRLADNKGLWLLWKLPEDKDLRIEFDVRSDSFLQKDQRTGKSVETFSGDLKCEAFNVEPRHQTGYIFIFGGWSNRVNRIARLEEHGDGEGARVVDGPPRKVEAGHTYRMKVLRVGATLGFYADDEYLVHYTDPSPITGQYFGFNNWRSALTFDNVAVYDVTPEPAPGPSHVRPPTRAEARAGSR